MKAIRLVEENRAALKTALAEVHPTAGTHVFGASDLLNLARTAEKEVRDFLAAKDLVGAKFWARSGHSMPNAYRYQRQATGAWLERRASGWFVVELSQVAIWPNQGGETAIHLTAAQDSLAVASFRRAYRVQNLVAAPA